MVGDDTLQILIQEPDPALGETAVFEDLAQFSDFFSGYPRSPSAARLPTAIPRFPYFSGSTCSPVVRCIHRGIGRTPPPAGIYIVGPYNRG